MNKVEVEVELEALEVLEIKMVGIRKRTETQEQSMKMKTPTLKNQKAIQTKSMELQMHSRALVQYPESLVVLQTYQSQWFQETKPTLPMMFL